MLAQSEISTYLDFCHSIMDSIRPLLTRYFHSPFEVSFKQDGTEVTEADKGAETFIREKITHYFPSHGIVGEEFPPVNMNNDYQWYIDPVDGTQNFANGIPTFGSILSLYYKREAIVGMIEHPILGWRYHASRGNGTWQGAERISIRDTKDVGSLNSEIISTTMPFLYRRTGEVDFFLKVIDCFQSFRIYGDCFGQTRAVTGGVACMINFNLAIWDISALPVLIEEAGGKFEWLKRERTEKGLRVATAAGRPAVATEVKRLYTEYRESQGLPVPIES